MSSLYVSLVRLGTALSLCLLLLGPMACSSASPTCGDGASCPAGTRCEVSPNPKGVAYACIREVSRSDVGAVCNGAHTTCKSNFCYRPDGKELYESYCSKVCNQAQPCPRQFKCSKLATGLEVCVRTQETGPPPPPKGCRCGLDNESCSKNGHEDCAIDQGYFCLSKGPKDPKAVCAKSCDLNDPKSCGRGLRCAQTLNGFAVCIRSNLGQVEIGGSCVKGGKADCRSGLDCYARWSSDPDAFCTKYCSPGDPENGCPTGYLCESPRERDPYLCIPKGSKSLGEDCQNKLFLDCASGVCAETVDENRRVSYFCSQSCNANKDDCPVGYQCRYFRNVYRYLCAKAGGGDFGSFCNKNGDLDCKSRICVKPSPNAINRICSQKCDATKTCPSNYKCDNKLQICVSNGGDKKIGEACITSKDCSAGICFSNSAGKQFCTQICAQNEQCPQSYECRVVTFGQRYCMPKLAKKRKIGEPCPNGSTECESNNCLTDPIKGRTFCSRVCDAKKPCPTPMICNKLTEQVSFCTPKDYVKP